MAKNMTPLTQNEVNQANAILTLNPKQTKILGLSVKVVQIRLDKQNECFATVQYLDDTAIELPVALDFSRQLFEDILWGD